MAGSQGEYTMALNRDLLHLRIYPSCFQVSLEATWNQAKHQGFWATWAQLVDLTDPRGEINAYKVLHPLEKSCRFEYKFSEIFSPSLLSQLDKGNIETILLHESFSLNYT